MPGPGIARAWDIEPVLSVKHTIHSSQAYYTMGRYYDGSQAWDKSIDAYRKAIAADAQNIEAYNALGVALAQSGRYADAETTLRQAIAIDPARTHMRSNLGYVLLLAGKPSEAVAELNAVVKQNGGDATGPRRICGKRWPERMPLSTATLPTARLQPVGKKAVTSANSSRRQRSPQGVCRCRR
jgi:tetratricopeptide (TPR) repeat protein